MLKIIFPNLVTRMHIFVIGPAFNLGHVLVLSVSRPLLEFPLTRTMCRMPPPQSRRARSRACPVTPSPRIPCPSPIPPACKYTCTQQKGSQETNSVKNQSNIVQTIYDGFIKLCTFVVLFDPLLCIG